MKFEGELSSDYHGLEPSRAVKLRTCCHCQFTWMVDPKNIMGPRLPGVPDVEKGRGYCSRCNGYVCGLPMCRAKGCVHFEAMLELLEKGIPWGLINEDMVPHIYPVDAAPPGA